MEESAKPNSHVLTIGHSNHSLERFLSLLKAHSIQVIVDTRSYPYSDYSPQFDRESLKQNLSDAGVKYVDLGSELGGRPKGQEFYDADGRVRYDLLAETAAFLRGLSRLEHGIHSYRVAVLCSEENPAVCHRKLLIGRVLAQRGFVVEHVRGDGRIQADGEVSGSSDHADIQSELFPEGNAPTWKSIPSVLRKRRQSSSSGR